MNKLALQLLSCLSLFLYISHSCFAEDPQKEHPALKRLQYGDGWSHQSIIVNGEEIYKSQIGEDSFHLEKFKAIQTVLNQYHTPFSVLEINSNNGFYSIKITEAYYNSVAVMVDESERLTEICLLNTDRNRLIHLRKLFKLDDLKELAKREHFDVILVHKLHEFDDNSQMVLEALLELGDNVIIEISSDQINLQNKKMARFFQLKREMGVELGSFHKKNNSSKNVEIVDQLIWFCQDRECFEKKQNRLGILPSTFFHFEGSYPRKRYVSMIEKLHGEDQSVLQGIDFHETTK